MPRCKNPSCKDKFQVKFFLQKYCMEKEDCIKMAVEDKKQKAWKKTKIDWKEKNKTLGQYELEARKFFQKWIRERDKSLPCISCQNITTDQWDAGHYFKAELYSGLIFNENNVHKQCKQCNHRLHGNESGFRIGLAKRYGEEYVKSLESLSLISRTYKFTKQELTEIKEKYQSLLKTNTL